MKQEPVVEQACCRCRPISPEAVTKDAEKSAHSWDYLYEPDAATVIDELLTRYIEALVYQPWPRTWRPSSRPAWSR